MLERMDWRSLSWIGVADWPAPPGAGAGTGTVGAAPVLRRVHFIDLIDNGTLLLKRTPKILGYFIIESQPRLDFNPINVMINA